ncbi:MAG: hypothetical protein N2111_00105 [Candidatus Sumerlaeaceae bacterium]|nr:hypothetical protein [Candidatus Sumerlaeaceae bacterium]
MLLPEEDPLPRDARTLLREVDAAIQVKDIGRIHRWRNVLERKWYESGLTVILFISGLGFMITVYKLLPAGNTLLFWFIFAWFALFTLSLIGVIELLLAKVHALRELYQIQSQRVEHLERRLLKGSPEAGPGSDRETG